MSNIVKMRVQTHPYTGQRYELICDYQKQSFSYKDEQSTEERYVKMNDQQISQFTDILERVKQLRPRDYKGPITNNGMYWEFDLVNNRNKMVEIEGINMIDTEVIMILRDLEEIINKPLGVSQFSMSELYDS
ncbi:MAG TPA: hypothetical protein GX703_05680 [Erysipelothrix sp.]|nr:hypothetical protein [Erysipelothrix sp.]